MSWSFTDTPLNALESLTLDDTHDNQRGRSTNREASARSSGIPIDASFVSTDPGAETASSGVHVFVQPSWSFNSAARESPDPADDSVDHSFASTTSAGETPSRNLYVFGQSPRRHASPSPTPAGRAQDGIRSQPAATTPASDSAPRVHSSSASSQENPRSPVATTTGDTVSPAAVVQPSPQPIPYDAKDEPAPAHALFTSTFQDALKDGRKIAQAAVAAIEAAIGTGTAEPDDLLRKLMQDAKGLTKFEGTDTRTIAVLGDSGEGKSSLINSLLHFPGVAQTSDAGSACTAVVTEYRQKKAEHTAPITIEVDYFSASEIAVLVRELLYSYRQLDLPLVQSLEDTSEEVYAKCERESANAWSLLEAAFKHKPQFTMSYARDTSDGALERISSQLIQWANELEWPNNGQEGRWVATATTAEDCVEQTKQFAHDKYWPFTKIIRVYLSSQVLKTGVVLADLPGLQDTNLARVRTTQKYLLKCDNILIVAKISRAITDKSLKSSLFYVLSQHMPLEWEQSGIQKRKVGVVCTKSEEINLKTAKSEFCGPGKIISPETMKHLDEEIESAKSCGDRLRKKSAKKQQQLALVRARAQHVKANLQRIYASKMDGRELQVFCVSNTWYEKYCPKGNQELVQGSGIPDLRRFCHTVAAEMHLNEAKQFLRSRLLGLLESLEVYVRSKMAVITQSDQASKARASRESLSKHLDSVAQENVALTDKFRCDFRSCFEEQILAFFGGRGQHWETAATKEAEKWDNSRLTIAEAWHWSNPQTSPNNHVEGAADPVSAAQINAWCLHNGHHQTARKPRENWNANIIWKMRTELETQWELLEEEAVDVLSAVIEGSKRHLESVKESVRSEAPRDCASPLVSGIDCQLRLLEYESKRLQRDFVEEVKALRRYASEANHNSFILQDMIPTYRSAVAQYGSGMSARQRSILRRHIDSGTMFAELSVSLSTKMDEMIASAGAKMAECLEASLRKVRSDVDIAFWSTDGVPHTTRVLDDATSRRLQQFAVAINDLKQRHEVLLQSIGTV
ncbi:hypothetical protein ACCO45_002420 [Purpureocillium lilacinum]|uniref:Uncharacterized protein n=1 Tax=Purpureocillium lilacinum TaxID=33203 RepID=A0ACC4E9W3_PURLI